MRANEGHGCIAPLCKLIKKEYMLPVHKAKRIQGVLFAFLTACAFAAITWSMVISLHMLATQAHSSVCSQTRSASLQRQMKCADHAGCPQYMAAYPVHDLIKRECLSAEMREIDGIE